MYYYKEENAYGDYVKDGTRFAVTEASVVVCPGKRTPEQCGWVQYPDLQTAVEAWGLTTAPLPEPEEEQENL